MLHKLSLYMAQVSKKLFTQCSEAFWKRMPGVSSPFYCSLLKIVGRKDGIVSKDARILSV